LKPKHRDNLGVFCYLIRATADRQHSRNRRAKGLRNVTETKLIDKMAARVGSHPTFVAMALFVLGFLLSLPFNPQTWTNYFVQPTRNFDLNFYLNIAERGYDDPAAPAFYPLWPLMLSVVHSFTPKNYMVQTSHLLSLAIFTCSLSVVWKIISRMTSKKTATWTVLILTLNPNSVFHGLAYPESLFCLLSAIFLLSTHSFLASPKPQHLAFIFSSAALMAATRPVLLQLTAACTVTVAILAILPSTKIEFTQKRFAIITWLVVCVSAFILAYIPFGLHCLLKFGNFFQPFTAQTYWKRVFGLNWSLFFKPETVGGSDNVLIWDLQAFYLPTFFLILLLYRTVRTTSQQANTSFSVTFITTLCLLVAAAHSAIAFLTYPLFMSLGRHVFATPFFIIGAAVVIHQISAPTTKQKIFAFYTFVSAVYFIHFWTRFGRSAWLG